MKKTTIILLILVIVITSVITTSVVTANNTLTDKTIYAKALENHQCDENEWHFLINQISDPSLAPSFIHVVWENGAQANLPLDRVTGEVAHYYYYDNLLFKVIEASATIYNGWNGEFNLSHGPCFGSTPTPTSTETDVATNTPTFTPTKTDDPTNTPTSTQTPTQTETDLPTNTPTFTPTTTKEPTDTPTPTSTKTSKPTITPTGTQPTPTNTSTNTPTVTATEFVDPTGTPTATVTQVTPTSTISPTVTPTEYSTPTPTITNTIPVFTPTNTPMPPKAAVANNSTNISNKPLGKMKIDGIEFSIFAGTNDTDGTLLLPDSVYGASLYNNTIWVHRLWKAGWLDIDIGDIMYLSGKSYMIVSVDYLPYGSYPKNTPGIQYLATCYMIDGNWSGIANYKLLELKNYLEK